MRLQAASVVLPCVLVVVGACSDATTEGHAGGVDSGAAEETGADGAPADGTVAAMDTGTDADAGGTSDGGVTSMDAADGCAAAGDSGAHAAEGGDGGTGCFLTTYGVYGDCITTTACSALGGHTSTPGYCPGAASIECCTPAPDVADNPPVPACWKLMQQAAVTTAMTTWAVMILDDPTDYPMFSTTIMAFGSLTVLARVEWHPPDFQNSAIHRGVTLYQPG